jgi:type II secretory pathway component PulL
MAKRNVRTSTAMRRSMFPLALLFVAAVVLALYESHLTVTEVYTCFRQSQSLYSH